MKSFSLSIPNPCSEDWNSFTPTATGGFCGSCQKNVIDFTKASDDEIIAFFSRKPEHACGRFRSDQLKIYSTLTKSKIRPGFMLLKAGFASLLLLLVSKPASAQTIPTKPKTEIAQQPERIDVSISQSQILVRGLITAENNVVMPHVNIVQQNTTNCTQTNADGRFELQVDLSKGDTLVCSSTGMLTEKYKITTDKDDLTITMKYISVVLGGAIGGIAIEEPSFIHRVWIKIRNIF